MKALECHIKLANLVFFVIFVNTRFKCFIVFIVFMKNWSGKIHLLVKVIKVFIIIVCFINSHVIC
jgi:hypothetical protein